MIKRLVPIQESPEKKAWARKIINRRRDFVHRTVPEIFFKIKARVFDLVPGLVA